MLQENESVCRYCKRVIVWKEIDGRNVAFSKMRTLVMGAPVSQAKEVLIEHFNICSIPAYHWSYPGKNQKPSEQQQSGQGGSGGTTSNDGGTQRQSNYGGYGGYGGGRKIEAEDDAPF